ncbi:MAG: hypothetical protein KDK25_05495 [Leptospiraceae bacterium]|nr:hypothetical protein [Leptospiraceae bacterium]
MYYLAITFIFIGLGCLLYLFVVRSFHSTDADPEVPEKGPELPDSYREHRRRDLEELGFPGAEEFPEEVEDPGLPLHSGVRTRSVGTGTAPSTGRLSRPHTQSASSRGNGRFEGVLFLDESGQAIAAAENWQKVSPDLFGKLKRMGPCELQYSQGAFRIHSDTARLQYRVDDLTRILFLDSGFAFIPEQGGPSPLILTREVDRFKDFLRDNSL